MPTTAKAPAYAVLLVLAAGLVAGPAAAQSPGEVTRVDGGTVYVQLADSITVDPGTVGRVVADRVVDGQRVQLTFAVLSVDEVQQPVTGPWVAACNITRQSRNLEAGDEVQFRSVLARARLAVQTTPSDVTVTIDGEEVGTTPLEGSIGAGPHELRLSREGYRPVTRTFSAERGTVTRLRDTLQTAIGTLTVTSLPDSAAVELGEQSLGKTPLTTEVREGSYTLRVRQGGYLPYEQDVTIQGGQETQINVPLRRPLRITAAEDQADEVTNVRVDREGDRLVVTYNLVGDAEAYAVELLLSTDGGQTFEPLPESVAGAVGARVTPDREKQIVWAATEDFPRGLTGTGNRLRLAVEPSDGNGLYWVVGSVLTAGAGTAVAALLGVFGGGGGGGGGGDLPDAPPPAPN